jgi:hypothetical protein
MFGRQKSKLCRLVAGLLPAQRDNQALVDSLRQLGELLLLYDSEEDRAGLA